jgi:NADH:ubiquinone oxidoreductase subunit 6 (subunit J)
MLDRIPLPSQFDRIIVLGGLVAGLVAAPLLLVLLALLFVDRINGPELVFWLAFALILAGALGTVLLSNIVHAAMCLVITLLGIAAIFLLLGQEFLALAQVLVYGGGVTILIIFALMMTNATDDPIVTDGSQKPFAFGIALIIGGLFAFALLDGIWGDTGAAAIGLRDFGVRLFDDFAIPFIVIAILLDVALSGALVIARRDTPEELEEAAQ